MQQENIDEQQAFQDELVAEEELLEEESTGSEDSDDQNPGDAKSDDNNPDDNNPDDGELTPPDFETEEEFDLYTLTVKALWGQDLGDVPLERWAHWTPQDRYLGVRPVDRPRIACQIENKMVKAIATFVGHEIGEKINGPCCGMHHNIIWIVTSRDGRTYRNESLLLRQRPCQ
ncbi:hypothetical protein FPQ18DRAFT_120252 [Pyronema domesticum]|uniref:Uncharacterized protein n=1 Tax=Pyronema omphalodes (strain CBS 100304) TaxID=1076935 RepID=U4LTH5_PYROM|nr:hypothetical protein FPQ18DRAFT_120252 [Pyronema domesticum]CCX32845.1 Protein of unknown function [Pyronema omphalodes CBS 100304]